MMRTVAPIPLASGLVATLVAALAAALGAEEPRAAKPPEWIAAMRAVHARFSGRPGTLAHFGDSITVTMAYWAPLAQAPRGLSPPLAADLELVQKHQRSECWREWKGPEFGSEGRMTIRWAHENLGAWLEKLNPEVAVFLFGTNDLTALSRDEYETRTREVVQRCLESGTIAVLTTIPPRHGLVERAAEYAEVVRKLARELQVPLIDYHAEILRRRPKDWDGALEKFKDAPGGEYEVPTLIARDGVHPSNPREFQDYSERSLSHNGYALRSALTLAAYAEIIRSVLAPSKPAGAAEGGGRPHIDRPVMFDTPEADAILAALEVFPSDNAFNQDVSDWPLHPRSTQIIASIGPEKPLRYNPDMAFVLVPPAQPKIAVEIGQYAAESDPGPYPVPENLPIEGWPAHYQRVAKLRGLALEDVQRDKLGEGGDRHAIIVDPLGRRLYEFYAARRTERGWQAAQASIFDLKSNHLRPEGWTSADAAGLPIFPAIVRFDEIHHRGRIAHALRVTVRRTRRAYVHPARHFASRLGDEDLPRMGERLRLRADFDPSGFSPPVRTILEALKRHGMLVADNGIEWAISVAPDPRIPELHEELRRVRGRDFEVVEAPR